MKRVLSLIIAVALVLACAAPAFAGHECDCGNAPILVISGMGGSPMILDEGTENEKSAFPPEIDMASLVSAIVKGIALGSLYKDWNKFADAVIPAVYDIFDPIACNPDGTSKYNISVEKFNTSMEFYPCITGEEENSPYSDGNEYALLRRASEAIGADHVYFFNYDWRLDPFDHAAEINELIQQIKRETGHDKVTLAPCSMGGAPTMAYLSAYGTDDVAGCVFLSTVFYGTRIASDLFSNKINFDPDCVTRYIAGISTGNEFLDALLEALIPAVNEAGLMGALTDFLNNGVDEIKDKVYDEVFREIFATMPGLWATVDEDYYDGAKAFMLSKNVDSELIRKIDRYHNEVALHRDDILLKAHESGVKIVVLSNYNSACIPVYESADMHSDATLETQYTSAGAVCAKMDETLPEGYSQENTECGHNHISPDNIIDASTCLFPEYTWFGKDWPHVCGKYDNGYCDFVMWLLTYRGQPTIHTNPDYPQFFGRSGDRIMNLETGEVLPLGFKLEPAENQQTSDIANTGSDNNKILSPETGAGSCAAGAVMLFALCLGGVSRKKSY